MDNILRLFLDRFDGKDGSFSFGTIKQHHITNVECEDKCVNEPGGTSQVAMSVFHQLSTTNNPWPGIAWYVVMVVRRQEMAAPTCLTVNLSFIEILL